MDDRLERVIRQQLRKAGRQFEEAKRAYAEGRSDAADSNPGAEPADRRRRACADRLPATRRAAVRDGRRRGASRVFRVGTRRL